MDTSLITVIEEVVRSLIVGWVIVAAIKEIGGILRDKFNRDWTERNNK